MSTRPQPMQPIDWIEYWRMCSERAREASRPEAGRWGALRTRLAELLVALPLAARREVETAIRSQLQFHTFMFHGELVEAFDQAIADHTRIGADAEKRTLH